PATGAAGRRAKQAAGGAARERRVHGVRVTRVELDLVDGAVQRLRERRASVRRVVDAEWRRGGRRGGRVRRVGGLAPRAGARAEQNVLRVSRLDRDPRDRPEMGDSERARDERPVRAAVRRLVETEAGLAVTARVPLAGAD